MVSETRDRRTTEKKRTTKMEKETKEREQGRGKNKKKIESNVVCMRYQSLLEMMDNRKLIN